MVGDVLDACESLAGEGVRCGRGRYALFEFVERLRVFRIPAAGAVPNREKLAGGVFLDVPVG